LLDHHRKAFERFQDEDRAAFLAGVVLTGTAEEVKNADFLFGNPAAAYEDTKPSVNVSAK